MRAATLLALMGVSRPIYHLIILNEAIFIVLSNHITIMLLPASHVTYTVYNFTDLINNSVCLSVCLLYCIVNKIPIPILIYSVQWQQQAEWRRTDINFAKTSEQRRLEEDVLWEEEKTYLRHHCPHPGVWCLGTIPAQPPLHRGSSESSAPPEGSLTTQPGVDTKKHAVLKECINMEQSLK